MKKALACIVTLALCIALLSGCSQSTKAAQKLSFSQSLSLEVLRSLNGKIVTLTGYMATLSPLSGEYIYLMNLPYQSCPFCVPNTQQLANTMAVYAARGQTFTYTDRPVEITGRLELGDYTDEYGYTYNYRIADARLAVVDLSKVSEDYAIYQSLAEDGVIAEIDNMFNYLLFICQWTEYQGSYTDEGGAQVSYYLYPGDVENILADESGYGYAAEAAADYYPGLIKRVEGVSQDLGELTGLLQEAQALESRARAALKNGKYTFDEATDKYILNDAQVLYDSFYDIYDRFSQWLTRYEL